MRSNTEVLLQRGFSIESVDYGLVKLFKPSNIVKSVEEAARKPLVVLSNFY